MDNPLVLIREEVCRSAAYHEAGHLVAAAVLGLPLRTEGVHVDSDCKGLSCLCCRNPGDLRIEAGDVEEREKSIEMLYAGYAAQTIFSDAAPTDGGKRDDEFASRLLDEMPLTSSQKRQKEVALRAGAGILVRTHWKAVSALADRLWSKPLVPRVDLGTENGWSDCAMERHMTGDEARDSLLEFRLRLEIWQG